jgi:hypothetical protein
LLRSWIDTPHPALRATFSRKRRRGSGDCGEIYSAVSARNSATSLAVSFEPFVPNRAVT